MDVMQTARQARAASEILRTAPTEAKNAALLAMARRLEEQKREVFEANAEDIRDFEGSGGDEAKARRLGFGMEKIEGRVRSLEKIAALADPVGQPTHAERRPNGLNVQRVRSPLGVILMIYEARPHVTVNAGAFCLKSSNAAILRGGSEARRCNGLLGELWAASLEEAGLPREAVQVVSGSHEDIGELLSLEEYIDLVIPRGGKGLIRSVAEQSKAPVIKHFEGVCHVYLDEGCDLERGREVVIDSKCLMPEVCNAQETLLVHASLVERLGPLVESLKSRGVELRGCQRCRQAFPDMAAATEEDWRSEYLDLVLSLRAVDGLDEAVAHINGYGSHHTDVIVTEHLGRAQRFLDAVDSGVVLVNASTMFCDGESLGMGAEIGISTDKLHARGPMGLEELTSYKFAIRGDGHCMADPDFLK